MSDPLSATLQRIGMILVSPLILVGAPHVHVWVNIADDPRVTLNARNLSGALRQ